MKDEIVTLLLYFDVFDHPLTENEIVMYLNLGEKGRKRARQYLQELVGDRVIGFSQGFYFAGGETSKVVRRKAANRLAHKRMKTATRFSRIISWFPFVRGVYLSGSISKGVMKKGDDIDYFIVTQPGRLWIARTLLTLFKKIFLLNSYRNFCINYFVDANNLWVKEQNRYTATEIVFLVPVFNYAIYRRMLHENEWVRRYFPGFNRNNYLCREKEPVLKKWVEQAINPFGERLNQYLFIRSARFIEKKFSAEGDDYFRNSFCIRKNELRYFPQRQQYSILERFRKKVADAQQQGKAYADLSPGKIFFL